MKRLEPRQFLPLEIIIWLGPRGFIPPLISSNFFLQLGGRKLRGRVVIINKCVAKLFPVAVAWVIVFQHYISDQKRFSQLVESKDTES